MISQTGPVISHAAENILEIMKAKEMRKFKIGDKYTAKYGQKHNAIKEKEGKQYLRRTG